ncbi:Glutathione transport system permease protein GsiC [subsurface metagenome]|jgi:peptide/nickel transport system permease protein
MRAYIIRRLLLAIPTMIIVSLVVFLLIRLMPGDVIDAIVANMSRMGVTTEVNRAELERRLGLDVPFFQQYGRWVGVWPQADGSFSGIFQGDLGECMWKPTTVTEEIAKRWPVTLELGLLGIIIGQLVGLPIGIYSALRQDTWGDYIGRSFAILCIAVPGFWIATMIIVFPSIWWGYMPPIMLIPFTEDPIGNLKMFIIPAIVLGMSMSGGTMRMTRAMVLEVLRQDYIRTAWAKGLRERAVVLRHTLKNALIPVVTLVGLWMPLLIGGAVILEQIFSLPGMGRLLVDATFRRDYTIVSGIMLLFGVGLVLINIVVDLTYAYLDPRVRYR